MIDFISFIRSAILVGCMCVLALVAFFWVTSFILRQWRAFWTTSRSLPFCVLSVAAILFAGTKPTAQVTWDEHFSDKSYSIDTNDLRRISFAWTAPAWMPETANAVLNAYGRTADIPDAEAVASAPMSAGAMTAVMPYESTNYFYFVACDWTPAPAVVTNGVYHVRAVENAGKVVPLGVDIKTPNQEEPPQ